MRGEDSRTFGMYYNIIRMYIHVYIAYMPIFIQGLSGCIYVHCFIIECTCTKYLFILILLSCLTAHTLHYNICHQTHVTTEKNPKTKEKQCSLHKHQMYIYVHVRIYIYTSIYTCTYMYIDKHYTCTYIYIYTCIRICTCTCTYICI